MLNIFLDPKSKVPKFKQISNSIITAIEIGTIKFGEQVPSISQLSEEYLLSRDTVEKAYAELRERGILTSVPNKGYFVNAHEINDKIRVFLLFNKLSNYKKIVYNSLIDTLGDRAQVDLFIHHNNIVNFKNLILYNLGNYQRYVIIPFFYDRFNEIEEVIKKIPKEKLIILDKQLFGWDEQNYSCVYQDYENDIYQSLVSAAEQIKKYKKILLVFPGYSRNIKEVEAGIGSFSKETGIPYEITEKIGDAHIESGTLFIVIDEHDLINIINFSDNKGLILGKDVGIISYNDAPLKQILAKGITVISTDFEQMGKSVAQIILDGSQQMVKNPFSIIFRKSL